MKQIKETMEEKSQQSDPVKNGNAKMQPIL